MFVQSLYCILLDTSPDNAKCYLCYCLIVTRQLIRTFGVRDALPWVNLLSFPASMHHVQWKVPDICPSCACGGWYDNHLNWQNHCLLIFLWTCCLACFAIWDGGSAAVGAFSWLSLTHPKHLLYRHISRRGWQNFSLSCRHDSLSLTAGFMTVLPSGRTIHFYIYSAIVWYRFNRTWGKNCLKSNGPSNCY